MVAAERRHPIDESAVKVLRPPRRWTTLRCLRVTSEQGHYEARSLACAACRCGLVGVCAPQPGTAGGCQRLQMPARRGGRPRANCAAPHPDPLRITTDRRPPTCAQLQVDDIGADPRRPNALLPVCREHDRDDAVTVGTEPAPWRGRRPRHGERIADRFAGEPGSITAVGIRCRRPGVCLVAAMSEERPSSR